VVSRDAGCAKGLVTYHFRNRDQLLASAAEEMLRVRADQWRPGLAAGSIEAAIQHSWDLLVNEAKDGFWRAWVSLSAEGTRLTAQTVNHHWGQYVSGVTLSASELLAAVSLEPTVEPGEFGQLLAAGFQGFGLQLATGAQPAALEGAHTALWAGMLGLTRPLRS
jgi:AcrR family transcriptional regulator